MLVWWGGMRERKGCGEKMMGRMRADERGREYGWREREKYLDGSCSPRGEL